MIEKMKENILECPNTIDLNILSNKILLSSSSDVISSAILNPFKNHSEFLLLSSEYFNKFNYYAYL